MSRGVRPVTSEDWETLQELTIDPKETPYKRPIGEDSAETIYKAPIGGSDNTMRESTRQYSGDSCNTPLKGFDPEHVYFPGAEDRSISQNLPGSQSQTDICTDSINDPPPPYTSHDGAQEPYADPRSLYQNALPVKPTKEHDIEIDEHIDYPLRLKAQHYDVFIVNHPDDFHKAVNVKRILEKYCVPDEEEEIKVLVLGHEDEISINITSRVQEIGEASDRSTMYFIIMSPSFCDDEFYKMVKDECLWLSCTDDTKRWSVIPLRSKDRQYKEPFGLGCLKGISLENDLVGNLNLDDPKLSIDDLKLKRNNVKLMIRERVHFRKKREKKQAEEKEEYTKVELHKRRLEAIRKQTEQRRKQLALEEETRQAVRRAQQRENEPLSPSELTPEKPDVRESGLIPRSEASRYQVHVTQNNYIGVSPVGEIYEDSDEEYEIIRGDPPRN